MRLLEGDVRAASMTASASGPRRMTHASNFSWRRRSAALAETSTVSMPNWRKHSVSSAREDSLRSTRAARAAAFLMGMRAGAVPKAFSMSGDRFPVRKFIVACPGKDGKTLRGRAGVQKSHYPSWTGGWEGRDVGARLRRGQRPPGAIVPERPRPVTQWLHARRG